MLILVVGHRYGATDTTGISYTGREYLSTGISKVYNEPLA